MKLTWHGTAAVMLESDGYRIVFDPFLGMPITEDPLRRERLTEQFRSADAVLVTHGHFDHIHDIPELYYNSDIEIYATKTPCKTLKELGVGEENLRFITPPESFVLGPFRITAYQGRHCRFDAGVVAQTVFKSATLRHPNRLIRLLKLNKRFDENGETLFYEIEAEDKRIHLMGSMGMDPDMTYPAGADILILPFQGTGNPAKTVLPIIGKLKPRSIFLDHYDDAFPPMSSEIPTADFTDMVNRHGIPCAALKQQTIYTI